MSSKGFDFFDDIYVINLDSSIDRKKYIIEHFLDFHINNYSFFKATSKDEQIIKQHYLSGFVKTYPSCFRCNRNFCSCKNNILIPAQVANFNSFIELMKVIVHKNMDGLTLICEDDVQLKQNAIEIAESIFNKDITNNFDFSKPILIALEQRANSIYRENICLVKKHSIMSNACFAINKHFANLFLSNLKMINTTSDIFIHSYLPLTNPICQSFASSQPLATQLSWNLKIPSEIHPKGIDEKDLIRMKKHIKRIESVQEYEKVFQLWIQ